LSKKITILSLLVVFSFVFFSYAVFSQKTNTPAPEDKIRAYVTDKTGTLSSSQIQSLETKLSNFEKETSNQVVIWLTPSLEGESLEEKSHRIAEENGIGQKGKDNGVLLFIAKNDRKLRIEVGYGLEGALPDALCDQIIRKEITPAFKKGNFYEGINAGVDAIIKATKGEYAADENSGDESGTVCGIPLFFLFILLIFILAFGIPILTSIFGRGGGRWSSGGSNWSSGSSSSWSSGSSFSTGGFSGGGGSFGGGGASGSW
jgi:uncharacterized protein